MKYIGLSFMAFCLILVSCVKHPIGRECGNGHESGMTGAWKWVKTDGGISPHSTTPASTGKNITLQLNADNTYKYTTNGAVTSQGTFSLESRKCIHDNSMKTWINFSNDQGMMIEKMESNELHLSEDFHDGFLSQYKKN